ncbi:hypothetical protein TPHA_0D00470 [Tetrapisispora phaffii CBS 4417]|uniref:Rab-GAP TBC domain-containing protein n=1 Tax=Tetrapisispora phaffii (strain ATCC 24235 / CBS 4417 / NBRC 1672 / NRRL Y-8282 / UCD 70-5) TaxID=1071381 RepID=G8BS70_TETPH|nr:hypothetical protein TPHA_0D00470 [Tetrapisispora phaffii CBS 4417]CCE62691.1 hypothetical protein TPHA_0D00470 [Tetrapisispora phaffii CBS 4417]
MITMGDEKTLGSEDVEVRSNEERLLKQKVIKFALQKKSTALLAHLGRSKLGFADNEVRPKCWSQLLNNQLKKSSEYKRQQLDIVLNSKEVHMDEHQVQLDVNRSFITIETPIIRNNLRFILNYFIIKILRLHPNLRYYQGYHDIISVIIVVYLNMSLINEQLKWNVPINDVNEIMSSLTETELFNAIESFTLLYLRDFMTDSLYFTIDQLNIIPKLIKDRDIFLFNKFKLDQLQPFYATSSLLTVYSHDLKIEDKTFDNNILFSIFDMIISHRNMAIPLVIYSNFIVNAKEELLKAYESNISNFENQNDLINVIIQKQTLNDIFNDKTWDDVLSLTRQNVLINTSYLKTSNVNKYSVLYNTGSGKDQPLTNYNIKTVLNYMKNELIINEKRKIQIVRSKKFQLLRSNISKSIMRMKLPMVYQITLVVLLLLCSSYYRHFPNYSYNIDFFKQFEGNNVCHNLYIHFHRLSKDILASINRLIAKT